MAAALSALVKMQRSVRVENACLCGSALGDGAAKAAQNLADLAVLPSSSALYRRFGFGTYTDLRSIPELGVVLRRAS